jgi:hypothetical protein
VRAGDARSEKAPIRCLSLESSCAIHKYFLIGDGTVGKEQWAKNGEQRSWRSGRLSRSTIDFKSRSVSAGAQRAFSTWE